ncbi:MAG TPA: hypothetical protein PK768_01100 [Tepidanaerobacteraceae bacterium]|nr:hypothetical protein [Tepidanaerobacteraceae bacterium]
MQKSDTVDSIVTFIDEILCYDENMGSRWNPLNLPWKFWQKYREARDAPFLHPS